MRNKFCNLNAQTMLKFIKHMFWDCIIGNIWYTNYVIIMWLKRAYINILSKGRGGS